jgi:glycine hydroxymethyltransferase
MKFLPQVDKSIFRLIERESMRQDDTLMLIPSENYASKAVEEAVGSPLGNKYAEGYPGKRYYQGQQYVDQVEQLCIDRAKALFDVPYANVQPYSGSPANTAAYFSVCKPGDTIMGLTLSHGGHLTHGHPKVTFSGRFLNSVQYPVDKKGLIDFDKLEALAIKHRPRVIIAGTTAYPRTP